MNKKDQKKIKNEEKIEDKKYVILLNYIRYRLNIDEVITMVHDYVDCCDICDFVDKKELCKNLSCEDGVKIYLDKKIMEEK